ncbi:DEAD/DEAH box helicase [Enterococcus sp. 2201sp1_2201st1_C11_2201SCRN_220225]|uniref:DEAD/DEAH box helicase n=2 Tax=unclassified Enterococcus TaxID=2608891 RepID=UPI0034A3C273
MNLAQFPESWQKRWQQEYSDPTAIQTAVFEPLVNKEAVVGISPTGTGKTIAYLLPLLLQVKPSHGIQLMIVTSSQELAMQVATVTRNWGQDIGLKTVSLIGGANVKRQQEKLKTRPEIVVGTPGRLVELMDSRKLKAHQIQSLVVDEVDQILGQGGEPLLLRLLKHLNRDCQLSFFSATADAVLAKIQTLTPKPVTVVDVTATDSSKGKTSHYYLKYPLRKKIDALRRILNQEEQPFLIFFNQVADLGAAEEKLLYHGLPVASLASDQGKMMRKHGLAAFREGKCSLLSTDVAARGLDIEGLSLVVNAEIPVDSASYLHRAGRVGRMGKTGSVVTIIGDHQEKDFKKLLKEANLTAEELFLYAGHFQKEDPEKTSEAGISQAGSPRKKTSDYQTTSPKKKIVKKPKKATTGKPKTKGKRRS